MKIIFRLFRYFFIGLFFIIRYFCIGIFFLTIKGITLSILVICLFISLLQVSSGFREEIIRQEQEMFYEKDNPNIDYYYEDIEQENYGDSMAITDLIKCYQEGIDLTNLPTDIKKYIDELNQLYNKSNSYFSFLYQDLFSGFTVSYNADEPIFTASTIKAPAMIYIYEKASLGEIDLNEQLVYTSQYYRGGTGILQIKEFNTSYSIEELLQYTIYYSDNIAYSMLMTRFQRENMLNFWNNFGTEYIFKTNTIWGYMSAKDASIYMRELYRFSKDNEEYGSKLLDHFKNAKWKLISDKNGEYNTANKGGWSGDAIHDIAIVFDENPYILVVMTKLGNSSYANLFNNTSKLVGEMHEQYWKYKVDKCSNINLY